MRNRGRGTTHVLRVEVREAAAERGARHGTWVATVASEGAGVGLGFLPYRIDNFTREALRFYQRGVAACDDALLPYNSALYAWDEPLLPRRLVVESPGRGAVGVFSLDDVGPIRTVRMRAVGSRPERRLRVRVHAEGPTRVLSVEDTELHPQDLPPPPLPAPFALLHLPHHLMPQQQPPPPPHDGSGEPAAGQQSSGGGSFGAAATGAFLVRGGGVSARVELAGVGVSLMGASEELLYASLSGLRVEATRDVAEMRFQARAEQSRAILPFAPYKSAYFLRREPSLR